MRLLVAQAFHRLIPHHPRHFAHGDNTAHRQQDPRLPATEAVYPVASD